MLLATCCPSPPLCWPGWRRGSSTSRFSHRRPMRSEVRIQEPSVCTPPKHRWYGTFIMLPVFPLRPPPAYLASVNAAWERAPMIYPRTVSDGQFYSPPESVEGNVDWSPIIIILLLFISKRFGMWTCASRFGGGPWRGGSWTKSCHFTGSSVHLEILYSWSY